MSSTTKSAPLPTKKKSKFPHAYVIIVCLLLFVSFLTYVIPAGEYNRVKTPEGITMVDKDSFQYVQAKPVKPWLIPNYILEGLQKQANIIFPLLLIGGALEVILATGLFHAYCNRLARACAGKEKWFIPVILTLFAVIGITQSTNKFIGFAPLGVMLAATLGYDAIVRVAIVLLGVGIGFSTGILAPTTAVAQEMAQLTAYSGMWLRVVSFVLFLILTSVYISRYAERARKDPTKSVLYGTNYENAFDLSGSDVAYSGKHPLILAIVVLSFAVLMFGCIRYGWGLVETAVCFLWMALAGGLVYGFGPSRIASEIVKGAKGMTSAALIVGLGAAVAIILKDGKVLDTVVMNLAKGLGYMPDWLKAPMLLIINVIVNGFVTSGTGQAAVVMPVLVPVADIAGITRQTTVLAYKFGDGFCNYILPHASALMGFLGATGISYDLWMKFMMKLFGLWMLLGSAILAFAHFIHYV